MDREEDMAGYAQQGSEEMLPKTDRIDMRVKITDVANGMAIFTLEGEFAKDKPYVDNATKTIRVPRGDVILKYTLDDETHPSLDLEFCRSSPIWVTTDMSICPTSACSENEIRIDKIKKKWLEVVDRNNGPGDFRFSLVLDGDSGRVLVDPIIKN